ncbi:MAG: ribosome small subunit-dependent GTPase A [Anaerolineales bacterium]
MLRGLVLRSQAGLFIVQTEKGPIPSRLRGRLKKGPRQGDLVAVGDWVKVRLLSDGSGVIEEIEPRQRAIVRLAPRPHGEYQQILLANPDQVLLVFACAQPEPRWGMLDRFLVIAEKQQVPPLIIANKVDLVGEETAREMFGLYEQLGYPVLYTSVKSGLGLEALKTWLKGKISALAGPSGVGKSSLLNAIQPGLGLAVREVGRSGRGVHTTVVRQLIPLDEGGYVADTPGWKSLALWDTQPEEVDGYFREIAPLVAHCQFSDCTHQHEPGCAVRAAVERGEIHPRRYASYLSLRNE